MSAFNFEWDLYLSENHKNWKTGSLPEQLVRTDSVKLAVRLAGENDKIDGIYCDIQKINYHKLSYAEIGKNYKLWDFSHIYASWP